MFSLLALLCWFPGDAGSFTVLCRLLRFVTAVCTPVSFQISNEQLVSRSRDAACQQTQAGYVYLIKK